MCVVPVVFSWTPYSWFQTRNKAELFVDKTIQSPPPPTPPPPLNLYKKSYIARGDNRWICSCHPTWPHKRQRTKSLGQMEKQRPTVLCTYPRPTFPYQRYLAPFMMVNRPARGLQLEKNKQTNKQTIKHLPQINGPQKALTKKSAGAGLNGPT